MIVGLLVVIVGFFLLIWGADLLVKHSVVLARILGVSTAVIGVTIVAFGTSLPEIVVSVMAAVDGNTDVAVSNVIGSNVVNIGLVLGVIALIRPVKVHRTAIIVDWPVMFLAAGFFAFIARDGIISPYETFALLFFLCVYVVSTIISGKAARAKISEDEAEQKSSTKSLFISTLFLIAGLILLYVGGRVVLHGVLVVAEQMGLSERVVGLTVVALGTSLPELVASFVAIYKQEDDIAIGTVLGSNIYNILAILGLIGLADRIKVASATMHVDIWVMLGFIIAIYPVMVFRKKIPRYFGFLLLLAFAYYNWTLFS